MGIIVCQEPIELAVEVGWGCLDVFSLACHISFPSLSLSLGEGSRTPDKRE